MLDHIGIKVTDIQRAKAFYDAALKPLGVSVVMDVSAAETGSTPYLGYGEGFKPYFWINEQPRATEIVHVAFAADSRATPGSRLTYRAKRSAAPRRINGPPGAGSTSNRRSSWATNWAGISSPATSMRSAGLRCAKKSAVRSTWA